MSTRKSLRQTLSLVLPAGALGASILLGLASQAATARTALVETADPEPVADQLRAIRATVSELNNQSTTGGSAEPQSTGGAKAEPAWWGNGGWGRWHLGWGNGGGWPNWHNAWHNGGNGGWPNWHNGWHNFWHNW
jgi:rSAM-associated Gly-rich repeat protein